MPISQFHRAKERHARIRQSAFEIVRREALRSGLVTVPLRLSQCDEHTLAVWRATWNGPHPSGFGTWEWEPILRRAWRRPTAFHLAIWSGDLLCGLAVGRLSRKRPSGLRHTISLHLVESAPSRSHPLRGVIAVLAFGAAEQYGRAHGASRLRLVAPLPGLLSWYAGLGFGIARKGGQAVYCERRIDS